MTAMADCKEQEASVQRSASLLRTGNGSVTEAQAEAEETDGAVKDSGSR